VPKSGQIWDSQFLARSPLLAELQALGHPLLCGSTWPSLDACSAFVDGARREQAPELEPVRFARPSTRNRSQPIDIGQLYDGRIALHAEVPCLGTSYHDLLNVLVWAAFPRTKRVLHARQYRALSAWLPPGALRLPNRRTREQDALALFDEGGSVLVLPAGAASPLEPARILLFGHAVMEHVCFEPTALSSAALVVRLEPPLPAGRELYAAVDRALAARLADPRELVEPAFDAVLTIEPPDGTRVRLERAAS